MEKIYLRAPEPEDEAQVWAYRQAFLDRGESVHGSCGLGGYESYAAWMSALADRERAETTPPGLVPASTFLAIREGDGALVGFVNIRHSLNEHFLNFSGHIGYSVHPAERRKGYAGEMLRQALRHGREVLGLERALVTCDRENEGSRHTILSQGGVLEDERHEANGRLVQRYWITL